MWSPRRRRSGDGRERARSDVNSTASLTNWVRGRPYSSRSAQVPATFGQRYSSKRLCAAGVPEPMLQVCDARIAISWREDLASTTQQLSHHTRSHVPAAKAGLSGSCLGSQTRSTPSKLTHAGPREAIREALTPEEAERLELEMRHPVDSGRGVKRPASAYLWASREILDSVSYRECEAQAEKTNPVKAPLRTRGFDRAAGARTPGPTYPWVPAADNRRAAVRRTGTWGSTYFSSMRKPCTSVLPMFSVVCSTAGRYMGSAGGNSISMLSPSD